MAFLVGIPSADALLDAERASMVLVSCLKQQVTSGDRSTRRLLCNIFRCTIEQHDSQCRQESDGLKTFSFAK